MEIILPSDHCWARPIDSPEAALFLVLNEVHKLEQELIQREKDQKENTPRALAGVLWPGLVFVFVFIKETLRKIARCEEKKNKSKAIRERDKNIRFYEPPAKTR